MKDLQEYLTEALRTDDRNEVIAMINGLKEKGIAEVTTEEGNGGKDSKYVIRYKRGLVYWIDFINKYEYLWGYDAPDGTSIEVNSTSELDRTDWDVALDPGANIRFIINNLGKHASKFKGEYTRYSNAYNRSNKSSDYERSFRAKYNLERMERRAEKYKQLLKFV